MSKKVEKMLEAMASECNRSQCCGCPTADALEAQAVHFGHRASSVNAAAMESFQLQVGAQNALLVKMQSEITLTRKGDN